MRGVNRESKKSFHFKRAGNVAVLTYDPVVGDSIGTFTFRFDQINTNTDFTGLFDEYRINCCVLKFYPSWGQAGEPGALTNRTPTNYQIPQLHTCQDDDDNAIPTINEIIQHASYRTMQFNRPYSFKFQPHASLAYFKSTLTTGYGVAKARTWLDMNNIDIPHYGFKFGIDSATNQIGHVYNFKVRPFYYFSCRGVR